MVKQTIVCVDDEVDNVEALERLLRPKYEVIPAQSAKEALVIIDQRPAHSIAAIVSDQRMPEMTGVEFFRETLKTIPDCSRILLTGYTDIESIISAVNSGEIFRYITKPWDPVDLVATVDRAVERFNLTQELKNKNAALAAAIEELKSLDQMKTEFMLLMGHELRTPLTSIINFSNLLQDEIADIEQKKYVAHIQKATARLEKLTGDILFLLELSSGKKVPQKAVCHLQAIASKVSPREIVDRLEMKIGDEKVLADQELLSRGLFEILVNARKFSPPKSKITVETRRVAPHRIDISVSSEGSPISPNVHTDLLHHSTGQGLGLATVSAILKAHGSRLEIERTDNRNVVHFVLHDL